jgi:ferritin-like metal-binding protein YciE
VPAEPNTRDAKLIQYLNEAYGKERQLETALAAHAKMASSRAPYKKRLQEHHKETKAHARQLKARIKKLGGTAEEVDLPGPDAVAEVAAQAQTVARKGAALAQGQLHALRGTSDEEKLLKNAKTEYTNEAEEIATYTAIEALAESVGDKETAKLAKSIRREEERMANYLAKLIPTLSKAVATKEIPRAERTTASRSSSRSTGTRSRAASGRSSASSSNGSTASKGSSSRSTSSSRSSASRGSSAKRASSSGTTRKRAATPKS